MEIERKYLVAKLPDNLSDYFFHVIEQAYLNTDPVVRIRKEDSTYYLTYKAKSFLIREEYNLPLTKEAYEHMLPKTDGNVLTKKRYLVPLAGSEKLTVELDIFEGAFEGLYLAEVEFTSQEEAMSFTPPAWFGEEVTFIGTYQNSHLSTISPDELKLV